MPPTLAAHTLSIAGQTATIESAELQLYHLDGPEADYNLHAELDGPWPKLAISGLIDTTMLPGPARARVQFIDQPETVVVDGHDGQLTNAGELVYLEVVLDGDRARITGTVPLEWSGFEAGEAGEARMVEMSIEVEAKVVEV